MRRIALHLCCIVAEQLSSCFECSFFSFHSLSFTLCVCKCVTTTHVVRHQVTLLAAMRFRDVNLAMNFLSSLAFVSLSFFLVESMKLSSSLFSSASLIHTDRLHFFNLTGDLTTRVDTLSAWTGQLFVSIGILGCQQNLVQRYLSIGTVKEIRK